MKKIKGHGANFYVGIGFILKYSGKSTEWHILIDFYTKSH